MQHTVEVLVAPQSACRADPGAPPWPRCPPLGASAVQLTRKSRLLDAVGLFWALTSSTKNIQTLCGSPAFGDEKKRRQRCGKKHTYMHISRNMMIFWAKRGYAKKMHIRKRSDTRRKMKRMKCLKTSLGKHTKRHFLLTNTSEGRMPDGPWRPHVIRDCNPVMASLISSSKS